MNYISIYDNVTGNRLAFLQNAYNVGYKLQLAKLNEATFTLPADDPKNKFCQPYRWVEMWDADTFVGLFRILPSTQTKTESQREVVYTCESVLATLMDDILFGWHEIGNRGVYTQEVISYILSKQTTQRWALNACDFTHQFLYGWENENLLSALFSVSNPFQEAYKWETQTDGYPWLLSLKAVDPTPKAVIQYRKNLSSIEKSVDPTNLCTRIYPLGYGEGDNQLNIKDVNNGQLYLDADTQADYGIVSRIWVDRRYQDAQSLYDAAQAILKELSTPYVSYKISIIQNDLLNSLAVGDYVRVIDDDESVTFDAQVVEISKSDVYGNNPAITLTIANKSKDVATTVADMADRTRIGETYAQGAVTVFTKTFADNADAEHPATLRFELPDNIVHINEITLTGSPAPFRAYSLAVGGGGGITKSTSDGGGIYTSTASGGGETATSEAVSLPAINVKSEGNSGVGEAKHNHGFPTYDTVGEHLWCKFYDDDGNYVRSYTFAGSGAHSHGAHSHNVTIDDHTHGINVDPHYHEITLENHVHDIEFGIYEGDTADTMTLVVDGTTVGDFEDFDALNLVPYLSKDDSGNIDRGRHEIEIYPDKLSRIEVDMMIQLFANSRGGGQY